MLTKPIEDHASVFTGIGAFEIAAEQMGWKNRFHCEIEDYQRGKLEKHFPNSESYKDIKELDATKYRKKISVLSGGFPCQDISAANYKATGIMGDRSGLWTEYARIIFEIQPDFIIIENSPNLLRKGFEKVLFDLSEIGYDAEWKCLKACDFGLPHERERLFIIAYPNGFRQQGQGYIFENFCYYQASRDWETNRVINAIQRKALPTLCESNYGFPERVVKDGKVTGGIAALHALGNAVCPIIPYSIFKAIEQYELLYANN